MGPNKPDCVQYYVKVKVACKPVVENLRCCLCWLECGSDVSLARKLEIQVQVRIEGCDAQPECRRDELCWEFIT